MGEKTRQTLAQMEVGTWTIALPKIEEEQAVMLPAGTLDDPRWTWRERPAAKLSRERGNCMNKLEGQLTAALKRLSAQYETEQRRHSGQIEALRRQVEALQRQVERLSGQVTDLTECSGTFGAGPGSGWR